MWNAIARFWSRMRVLSVLLIAGSLVAGGIAYFSLIPREGFPALELPILGVEIPHASDDPLKADATIAARFNRLIGDLDGVIEVQSRTSSDHISATVVASADTDVDELASEVSERLDAEGVPAFVLASSSEIIGFNLALSSPQFSAPELAAFGARFSERLAAEDDLVLKATPERQFDSTGKQIIFSRTGRLLTDGSFHFEAAITVTLNKHPDVDSVTFSSEVHDLLESELRPSGDLPDHVRVTTIGDPAELTQSQISGLQISLLQSLGVVAVMVLLLVSWRAAIVSVVFIPTVMAATILVMYLSGSTLNTISMFGLLLVLGLFVDDIIVVVESIDRERANGLAGVDALKAALRRVGAADVMGSLTTIAVFGPLLFIPGLTGKFIRQLPLAVITALSLSVLLALSAFLWFSSTMLREPSGRRVERPLNAVSRVGARAVGALGAANHRLVGGYLRRRTLTTLAGLVGIFAIVVGTSVMTRLDLNIVPTSEDAPSLSMTSTFNGARSIEDALEIATAMEQKILAEVGSQIDGFTYQHSNQLGAFFQLDLRDDRSLNSVEISEILEESFEDDEVVSLSAVSGDATTVARFAARDSAELAVLESNVERFLAEQPEVRFASYASVSEEVQRWDDSLVIGATITLVEDADALALTESLGERAEVDGLGIGIRADAVDTTNALEEDRQRGFGSMGLIIMAATVMVAILLALQFRSFVLPGLILMAIPLSLPLLFPGLLGVGADLSIFVMLGISALIGIAVNNSIMLIDCANQEIRSGAEPVEAILEALRIRFRPLLTTTLTTVVGVFPLTTDPQFSGLAWTVIFGMISSTLLVLTVFPAYYVMVQTPRSALARWRQRRKVSAQPPGR